MYYYFLGIRNGLTAEFAEAEAVLEICKWRKRMLQKEQASFSAPPSSRWGLSLVEMGLRAAFLGGWGEAGIAGKQTIVVFFIA
jgi:hypothetical protein